MITCEVYVSFFLVSVPRKSVTLLVGFWLTLDSAIDFKEHRFANEHKNVCNASIA